MYTCLSFWMYLKQMLTCRVAQMYHPHNYIPLYTLDNTGAIRWQFETQDHKVTLYYIPKLPTNKFCIIKCVQFFSKYMLTMQNPFHFGIKTGSHPTTKMSPVVSLLNELVLFNSNKIHVKHANKLNKCYQWFDFPISRQSQGK